jgi:hypothetical protein
LQAAYDKLDKKYKDETGKLKAQLTDRDKIIEKNNREIKQVNTNLTGQISPIVRFWLILKSQFITKKSKSEKHLSWSL